MSRKPVDVIIVPTIRPRESVDFAVSLGDLIRADTLIIRDNTIAEARNKGLEAARACGWEHVMFLDDDIQIHQEQVMEAAGLLRHCQVAAFTAQYFPDNSVVRHAARAAGIPTPVFCSGGAMLVNMRTLPEGQHFPDIYNEDWFFMHGLEVGDPGNMTQLPYDPFVPGRAAREEFGDLIAEGIQGKPVIYDRGFWEAAIREREEFLSSLHVEGAAAASVQEACDVLAGITVTDVQKFLHTWQRDVLRLYSSNRQHDRFVSG
jgi:hypothetical protein